MTRVPAQYQSDVTNAAKALGIPTSVVAAQINEESGFDPQAVSPTGAEGIAQFEPGTWASYGTGSPFNPADAFAAYTKYMGALLRQFKGNVQDALAAYNAGPGNIGAGMGYANTILSAAGQGYSITAGPGTAQLDSKSPAAGLLAQASGVATDAQTLLHDTAEALNWFFEFFHPGQGWRLAFGAGSAAAGAGTVRAWQAAGTSEHGAALPAAILLAGVTALTAYMALRPWPQVNGASAKPGAYAESILEGNPLPEGPAPASDTGAIETGLLSIITIWSISKIAGALNIPGIFGGGGGSGEGGGAPPEAPPVEEPLPIPEV